jgi:predicted transposase YbfD/YdcC
MPSQASSISEHFSGVSDPRSGDNVWHPLINIMTIAICGAICGADNWVDMEMFGIAKQDWFASFLDLKQGIPSHDTFGRVFRRLNPDEFQDRFMQWTGALRIKLKGEVLSVDGKTERGSKDTTLGLAALEMVSVWASENELVLAQGCIDEGTNEITVIPELLRLLDLEGTIITIDAIGCQTEIAEAIVEKGADYVLALKTNQEKLFEDVVTAFEPTIPAIPTDYHRTVNKGHGRIETRECWALSDPDILSYISAHKHWPGLQSLVKLTATRLDNDQSSQATRYFISSLPPHATQLLAVVRAHWQIENRLHWVLDMAFREDANRSRKDHAAQNLAILHHIALNLLKQEPSLKVGIKAKRLRAGWDERYLLKVLASA